MRLPDGPTRILIVDDHGVFRDCLSRGMGDAGEFSVAGTAGTVADAMALVDRGGVDVVLLDYDLGSERGTELLRHIRTHHPSLRVLVLTAWVEENEIRELVALGVNGVILKKHDMATLSEAIRAVADARTWFDDSCAALLFAEAPRSPEAGFTEREKVILRLVIQGLTNKEIAIQVRASESSVKATLQRLFEKLGVRSRGQLVREALEHYKGQY